MSDQEKDTIRQSIAQGLAAQDTKLRTAVAMSISSIAKWDYPSDWPALLPGLLRAIGSQDSLHLVSGALSCLAMFADDLDEDHIIQVHPSSRRHGSQKGFSKILLQSLGRTSICMTHQCHFPLKMLEQPLQVHDNIGREPRTFSSKVGPVLCCKRPHKIWDFKASLGGLIY